VDARSVFVEGRAARRESSGRAGVVRGNGEDLGVGPVLIAHPENGYRADEHVASREGRLLEHDQHLQRVAVLCQRARDEPVVEGYRVEVNRIRSSRIRPVR
jgi:hypothetical protein